MKRQHETASTTQATKKQKLDEENAALKHQPKNDNADHKSSVDDEPTSDKETNAVVDQMNVEEAKDTHVLRIWQEHTMTRELYKSVMAEKDLRKKQALFKNLVLELSSHELAEESVIQPAFRNLTKDENVIKMAREQESNFLTFLKQLDAEYGSKMDESINAKLEKAFPDLVTHMQFEETKVLPVLENGLKSNELDELNTWFDKVKKGAPEPQQAPEPEKALETMTSEQPKLAPLVDVIDNIQPNKEAVKEVKEAAKAEEKK